jgi:hypothetical protein
MNQFAKKQKPFLLNFVTFFFSTILTIQTFIFSQNSFALSENFLFNEHGSKSLVPVTNVFIPLGFDQNDSAEIVVAGHLPNLCFQNVSSKFEVHADTKEIEVSIYAEFKIPTSGVCLEIHVPFLETVYLGQMPAGKYSVVVNKNDHVSTVGKVPLSITESTSTSIDDYNYAKITNVTPIMDGTHKKIKIEGIHFSSCLRLKEVKFYSNGLDTMAVLPVLEQFSEDCRPTNTTFSQEVIVPWDLQSEGILLHVRSMGGKAVNVPIGVVF